MQTTQTIHVAMPFDLVKSGRDNEMRIGGYASTAHRDRDGESVMQKSLDISEFVTSGFFNLDHNGAVILGYPDEEKCRIDDLGLYVEGTLLKGVREAESIYSTAVALQKSGTSRRLGFSVEGRILARDAAGLITKAKVYNVAITSMPVNPNCTWDALCKSFAGTARVLTGEEDDTYAETDVISKALDTAAGEPLIPESLESAFRSLADCFGGDERASVHIEALRDILRRKTRITKSECALYFTLTRGVPLQGAMDLADNILRGRETV